MSKKQFHRCVSLTALLMLSLVAPSLAAPTRDEAKAALIEAVTFMHRQVAVGGGYVWRVSGDLEYRMGEGLGHETLIWVQPPGTPTVGEALLDAYEATGDRRALDAAVDCAHSLVYGQLESGGWAYSIETDRENPGRNRYRFRTGFKPPPEFHADQAAGSPQGWQLWRQRTRGNITTLDDDTTQAATRFLIRMDKALSFKDKRIHDAATYALASLLAAQYPAGGWSHNFDRFPDRPPDPAVYPVVKANFPDDWSRTWPKTYDGCYVLNDNLVQDMIDTLLLAADVYKDGDRYFAAAKKAGDFLVLAQLPAPQPGWAQQYNRHMQPTWARKFEPPSVTGGESQNVMRTLMTLYRRTADRKYLAPLGPAIKYYRKCELPGDRGRIPRFLELKTNRPLYFKRDTYELTYSADDLPTHYGFITGSGLDSIEREYRKLLDTDKADLNPPPSKPRTSTGLARDAERVIAAMDNRGAWIEPGEIRDDEGRKARPESGVIESRTFVENVRVLCRFIEAAGE